MQEIIIIAGPNGAGKTSFANEFLREHRKGLAFVNADEIARTIADGSRAQAPGEVGRLMGKIIDVDKAQEALDRAARRARSGSAEVRAGRFVVRDARSGRTVGDAKKSKSDATRGKK